MPKFPTIAASVALLLTAGPLVASTTEPPTATVPAPPRFALLVSVQKYKNLSDYEQLQGCENDTQLVRQLLTDRYGFRDDQIVVRTNEQATGDAIRAEFSKLVAQVRALPAGSGPAQVVFHFSGHGSQISDQPEGDSDCDEQDGLDETLVPYDATKQGGPQDVRDDDLFACVDQLCEAGRARVWLILDCCHSGTGARGTTRFRALERGSVIALPPEQQANRRFTPKRLPDGAVLLAACRSNEKEPEFEEDGKQYGLLTRFLAQVLNEEQSVSRLTFDALRESIAARYRLAGICQAPMPQLEGAGRNSIVLGANSSLDRKPFWKVLAGGRDRSTAVIAAGALHGLTAGSLFEVYERPDQIVEPPAEGDPAGNGGSVAWLRVEAVEGVTATAAVFRFNGDEQAPATLPTGFRQGYAVERHHAHGDFVLRVRVVQATDEHQDGPPLASDDPSVPATVRTALSSGGLPNRTAGPTLESPWLRWSTGGEPCDVIVRLAENHAAVFPSTGKASVTGEQFAVRGNVPPSLRGGWGPIDVHSADAAGNLVDLLRQINRVRNLLRVAAMPATSGSGGPQVQLELAEIEVDDRYNITADRPWPVTRDEDGRESLVMRDGGIYTVRVKNLEPKETGKPVYVTVLHVDANMGIDVLLPYEIGNSDEQKILPGESLISGPFQCNGGNEPSIHGPRSAIVLATREPNDFYLLAEPSLSVSRGAVSARNRALDDLLVEQTYFRGTRGGTTRLRPTKVADASWSAQTIQWLVTP